MSTSSQWQSGKPITWADLDKAYTEAWSGEVGSKPILASPEQGPQWMSAREKAIVSEILPMKTVEVPSPSWIDRFTPDDNKQLIWTPPPGMFPEPEPKPEVIIPNASPQHVGRWLCSVKAIVREAQPPTVLPEWTTGYPQYWSVSPAKNHIWIEAAPDADDGRSTRQAWMNWEGDWTESLCNNAFATFVQEIEQDPDCCSKHKILMRPYDGSPCVGKREHSPPPTLAPLGECRTEPSYKFGFSGFKQVQSGINPKEQWLVSNLSVASPRIGFKLHDTAT